MAFDPSSIKPKRFSDDVPGGSSREGKIRALAEQLHERGLTASLADARRLAEGMVDTEKKLMKGRSQEENVSELRDRLQSSDPLFKAVGISTERKLKLPADFASFVTKAANLGSELRSRNFELPKKEPVTYGREEEKSVAQVPKRGPQITYAEAPDLVELFKTEQTEVESSEDGVVVRTTQTSEKEETVEEVGLIKEPESSLPVEPDEPVNEEKPRQKQAEEDIDLFDIFKTG